MVCAAGGRYPDAPHKFLQAETVRLGAASAIVVFLNPKHSPPRFPLRARGMDPTLARHVPHGLASRLAERHRHSRSWRGRAGGQLFPVVMRVSPPGVAARVRAGGAPAPLTHRVTPYTWRCLLAWAVPRVRAAALLPEGACSFSTCTASPHPTLHCWGRTVAGPIGGVGLSRGVCVARASSTSVSHLSKFEQVDQVG